MERTTRTQPEKPITPFALSLVAGLLILVGGGTGMMWTSMGMPSYGGMMGGMMSGWQGMMSAGGLMNGMFLGMTALGVVSGLVVLLGAFMIYNRPSQAETWGIVVLVFSALSIFGMAGFFFGGVLGVLGGILALTWRQT